MTGVKDWLKANGIKYTAILVAIFVAIFLYGLYNESHAHEAGEDLMPAGFEVRVGLGTQAIDRDDRGEHITQEVMVLYEKDWYAQYTRFGNGDVVPDTNRFSGGYRVDFFEGNKVEPYMRLGMAWWNPESSVLVSEQLTFDMSVGARFWGVAELEWQHNSTAGRAERNSGVDLITLGAVFRF